MPRQVAPSVDAATWTARIHDRRRMIAHESGTHQLPCRVPRPALDSPEYHRTHAYAYACARMPTLAHAPARHHRGTALPEILRAIRCAQRPIHTQGNNTRRRNPIVQRKKGPCTLANDGLVRKPCACINNFARPRSCIHLHSHSCGAPTPSGGNASVASPLAAGAPFRTPAV